MLENISYVPLFFSHMTSMCSVKVSHIADSVGLS